MVNNGSDGYKDEASRRECRSLHGRGDFAVECIVGCPIVTNRDFVAYVCKGA